MNLSETCSNNEISFESADQILSSLILNMKTEDFVAVSGMGVTTSSNPL